MNFLPHILLIEDNKNMVTALREAMYSDYILDCAQTGRRGIYHTDREQYDAIILDLQLGDMQGIDVCRQLRERGIKTPVLVLSATTNATTKVSLFNAGANDYLTKPFSLGELKARIQAAIRDDKTTRHIAKHFSFGEIELNASSREVSRGGQLINLRRKEFSILERLIMQPEMVVSRDSLINHAWSDKHETPWANTIDVHIKYLRDKIDRPFTSAMIQTVHGIGYKLINSSTDYQTSDQSVAHIS